VNFNVINSLAWNRGLTNRVSTTAPKHRLNLVCGVPDQYRTGDGILTRSCVSMNGNVENTNALSTNSS
jgi:hypothetical protein